MADYSRLVQRAGLVVRKREPGRPWLGDIQFDSRGDGARVGAVVPSNSPVYAAGIDQDDTLTRIGGEHIGSPEAVGAALGRHRPGERVTIAYVDRTGTSKTANVVLEENRK